MGDDVYVYDVKIKSLSDWCSIEILGEYGPEWLLAEGYNLSVNSDGAPDLAISVENRKIKINKKQFDDTAVNLSVPIIINPHHRKRVDLHICKGDLQYVEVSLGDSKVRNDINRPNDPNNCIEGTLFF